MTLQQVQIAGNLVNDSAFHYNLLVQTKHVQTAHFCDILFPDGSWEAIPLQSKL